MFWLKLLQHFVLWLITRRTALINSRGVIEIALLKNLLPPHSICALYLPIPAISKHLVWEAALSSSSSVLCEDRMECNITHSRTHSDDVPAPFRHGFSNKTLMCTVSGSVNQSNRCFLFIFLYSFSPVLLEYVHCSPFITPFNIHLSSNYFTVILCFAKQPIYYVHMTHR